MNELTLPFRIKVKTGKTKIKYPIGESEFIIKAKYKVSLAIGICWLSFKVFFVGIKTFINYKE